MISGSFATDFDREANFSPDSVKDAFRLRGSLRGMSPAVGVRWTLHRYEELLLAFQMAGRSYKALWLFEFLHRYQFLGKTSCTD